MSQQPNWITEIGSLGTVPEGRFYKLTLLAVDPDYPGDATQISYALIAGQLPAGVALNNSGTIEGIPESILNFKGVPTEVSENVTSKFTVRAISKSNRIADRTFTLTVTGQDAPEFVTPAGLIGGWFDGDQVSFQIETKDNDPLDYRIVRLIGGDLPPGLIMDETGLITGYIEPIPTADSAFVGWDTDGALFDVWPYDFGQKTINKNYQFTLEVSDGKDIDVRVYEMAIISRDELTVDSTIYLADDTFIINSTTERQPFLTEYEQDFGRIRHDNFFAYQFLGVDPNGGEVQYKIIKNEFIGDKTVDTTSVTVDNSTRINVQANNINDGILPETLQLDIDTGWLYGYLIGSLSPEIVYNFILQLNIKKPPGSTTPPVTSKQYNFTFTVVGSIETEVVWLTDSNLGIINNGDISTFYVEAQHLNTQLFYRLYPGSYSKLPQGLNLQQSGNIIGRTSFKTFSLDAGTTTFNAEFATRLEEAAETTFDRTFVFTVEAYSTNGLVSVTKEFYITVNKETDTPYNILYAKAMPPQNDRDLVNSLITNSGIMDPSIIYRQDDYNFGVAKGVYYTHAYGLTPATIEEYFDSFTFNHYHKTITLGEIKTARALDDNGNVLYEVVYSTVIDDLVNTNGKSIPPVVDLNRGIINEQDGEALDIVINNVYPNSLENMREEVIDNIGQVSKLLPRWMLSKQEDGRVLGFTPAWVIAFTNPGQSSLLAYKIGNEFTESLNKVDFTLDRFTLDSYLSKDWLLCEGEYVTVDNTYISADDYMLLVSNADCVKGWAKGIMTTFDRDVEGLRPDSYTADINTLTADTDEVTADHQTSYSSAQIDEMLFDGGSCRFISPVDVYNQSNIRDKFDKYIMFPQVNVTNTIPIVE